MAIFGARVALRLGRVGRFGGIISRKFTALLFLDVLGEVSDGASVSDA